MVAAGRGERAATGDRSIPKQFRLLLGKPLIAWSCEVLQAAGCRPLVAVIPPDGEAAARAALGDDVQLVVGGATRSESVRLGLVTVDDEFVVVHDAVRPLASVELVERVVNALEGADAVLPALPIDETVKRVVGSEVAATVDRRELWRAQTPQAFRTSVLKRAHEDAARNGIDATDDSEVVERAGGRVRIVEGSPTNIKVTWPSDFYIAESLLRARR